MVKMLILFVQFISVMSWEKMSSTGFYQFYTNKIYPDILGKSEGSQNEFSDPKSSEERTFRQVVDCINCLYELLYLAD